MGFPKKYVAIGIVSILGAAGIYLYMRQRKGGGMAPTMMMPAVANTVYGY